MGRGATGSGGTPLTGKVPQVGEEGFIFGGDKEQPQR